MSEQSQTLFLGGRVRVLTGDITRQEVDAIVNAANSSLLGGLGVDGAIHRAGGPSILEECRELRRTRYPDGLPTGEAVITGAGLMPARFVIHTVGPIWGREAGREEGSLAACYGNSLRLAAAHELRGVAFPSISTGAFGFPRERAAAVASQSITDFLEAGGAVAEVRLVFFSHDDAEVFLRHQAFQGLS